MLCVLIYESYYYLIMFQKVPMYRVKREEHMNAGITPRENYSCSHEVENFKSQMSRLIVIYLYNSTERFWSYNCSNYSQVIIQIMFKVVKSCAPKWAQRPHFMSMLFHETTVGGILTLLRYSSRRQSYLTHTNVVYWVVCIFTGIKDGLGLNFSSATYYLVKFLNLSATQFLLLLLLFLGNLLCSVLLRIVRVNVHKVLRTVLGSQEGSYKLL